MFRIDIFYVLKRGILFWREFDLVGNDDVLLLIFFFLLLIIYLVKKEVVFLYYKFMIF